MSIVNESLLSNPKIATTVMTATSATGAATWADWIPINIGWIASLVGACLSVVLTVYWIRKIYSEHVMSVLEREKLQLEIDQLKNAP